MKFRYTAAVIAAATMFAGCEPNVDTGEQTDINVTGGGNEITSPEDADNSSDISADIGEKVEMLNRAEANPDKLNEIDNTLIGWGIGKNTDKDNRPTDAVQADEKYADYGAEFIGENEKRIILTFDCGYENGFTQQILDTLKEKNAQAVFFVTYDYCKRSGDIVKRMISDGHIVGNHSTAHLSFPSMTVAEMTEDIATLHDYVESEFGYSMNVFRFPMGEYSERCLALVQKLGYKPMFWSFAHVDWDTSNQPSAQQAYEKITSSTHNGEIVLLHAVSRANAECLGDVLDFWQSNGYTITAG